MHRLRRRSLGKEDAIDIELRDFILNLAAEMLTQHHLHPHRRRAIRNADDERVKIIHGDLTSILGLHKGQEDRLFCIATGGLRDNTASQHNARKPYADDCKYE